MFTELLPLVESLSKEFSSLLRKELTPEELATVRERNKTEEYSQACATHDFLDANMVMDEAFTNVFKKDFDINSDESLSLWNAAWELSRKLNFEN